MTTSALPTDLPIQLFDTADDWRAWLEEHHGAAPGLWLKMAKKSAAYRSVNYAEALDEALCYGWIDGLKKSCDESAFLQRFTPRGPRSIWSQINRDKALQLIEAGRMRPAGQAAIDRAKANGQWERAYASQSNATVPDDLQAALDANADAKAFFATLSKANRNAILFRVEQAKRPETRARRIDQFVVMLARGETIYPQGPRAGRQS
jgi:uncharacterized protein YdeI (YjbR/CyaY-like superfamily)